MTVLVLSRLQGKFYDGDDGDGGDGVDGIDNRDESALYQQLEV